MAKFHELAHLLLKRFATKLRLEALIADCHTH